MTNHIFKNTKGLLHRVGSPAIIKDGREEWWINGLRHNINGPAIIDEKDMATEWWQNDKRHRPDGPAVEYIYINDTGLKNSLTEYWLNNNIHNHSSPASRLVIHKWNNKYVIIEWYKHGVLHREKSPAFTVIINDQVVNREFWYNGKKIKSIVPRYDLSYPGPFKFYIDMHIGKNCDYVLRHAVFNDGGL